MEKRSETAMKIAIVQLPESNDVSETLLAVSRAGMEPVEFLWHGPHEALAEMAGFIIIGSGVFAAFDPIMQVIHTQCALGKPVLGIAQGARLLLESGLVPGLEDNRVGMALSEKTGDENALVTMRLSDHYQRNAFTRHLTPTDILQVQDCRMQFLMPPALRQEIETQGLDVFQYCDTEGAVNESPHGIAAVSNKAGNAMAIVPRIERTHACDAIFHSMRDFIAENHGVRQVSPLHYYPRPPVIAPYKQTNGAHEWVVELRDVDKEAEAVQRVLRQLGYQGTVKRFSHWEIECNGSVADQEAAMLQVKKSGVLFDEQKEREVTPPHAACLYLVRSIDDLQGRQRQQQLQTQFAISHVTAVRYGVLWQFIGDDNQMPINLILDANIIYNPYAHVCYQYKGKSQ